MPRRRLVAASVMLVAISSVRPVDLRAQAPAPVPDPAAALARPLSPGSVALLVPHANQPAVIERLRQALADPRPDVRAIAARVAFTTRQTALAAALSEALDREESPLAGTEIVRALALIGGAPADARIIAALGKFDARATSAWVETVNRVRPAALWTALPALPNPTAFAPVLHSAARRNPEAAASGFAALKDTPALQETYVAMVQSGGFGAKLPPWPVLAIGLAVPGRVQDETAYVIAVVQARGTTLPPEAEDAIRGLADPASATHLRWLPVYQELVRRGAPDAGSRPLVDAIAVLAAASLPDGLARAPEMARLDAAEAAAFRKVLGPDWNPPEKPPDRSPMPAAAMAALVSAYAPDDPPQAITRFARPLTPSLLGDLGKLLDCRPMAGQITAVEVKYRPSGQVRNVSQASGSLPAGCQRLAQTVASLDHAPGHDPVADARTDLLVVGIRPTDLECEGRSAKREPRAVRPSQAMRPPKKTRNVPPDYPQPLIEARIQGVVIIEAVIPLSGCVADARVLRHVHPGLDVSALAAVSEWRYETAVLNGEPVPVIMTVTVNFALK